MYKKSLLALATLGVFAGGAVAADVSLYGVLDQGFVFNKSSVTNGNDKTKTQSFEQATGLNAPSRFGLVGSEDLGNGLKLGFKLENSFNGDDGTLGQGGRLFGRESSLTLSGDFGALSVGRMGGVASSAGTYDLVYAYADAFDGGDNAVLGLTVSSRYDNMLTYQTPKFGGVQATVQYSFKGDDQSESQGKLREGSAAVDRYASFALTGDFGPLQAVTAFELQNYASNNGKDAPGSAKLTGPETGKTFYLGGNYDCGFAKTFVLAQYFQDQKELTYLGSDVGAENGFKGYGLHVGTQFPALAGNVTAGLYYVDATAENTAGDRDTDYVGASLRYAYSLSKRTTLYTGAGYAQANVDATKTATKYEKDVTQVYAGLTHTF